MTSGNAPTTGKAAEGQLARGAAEVVLSLEDDRRSRPARACVARPGDLGERRAGAAALHALLVHLSSSSRDETAPYSTAAGPRPARRAACGPRPRPRAVVAASRGRPVHSGPSRSRRGGRRWPSATKSFARSASWSTSGSRCATATKLAARVWLPVDAEADPVPAILEAVPYRLSDGMATRDVLIHPYWAARGYACVRVDLRGSGESDGVLEDEYHPQEQEDLPRGHRLARRPAVVLGRRRHDRHLVGRLQQPPAGRPPAAGAQGDHHAHEHRRPLRRRRALQGRLRARDRPAALEHLHAALAVPAAARGGRRRALARALGAAARGERAVGPHLARAPAARRLLEARLGLRGLRRDRGARLRRRRLDGRLHQQRPPPARRPARAAQGAHRSVAARVPAPRHAGPRHRLPAGGAALVGPLAEGRRHRRSWTSRCCACGCRSPCRRRPGWTRCRDAGWRRTSGRRRASRRGGCGWTRTACCATPAADAAADAEAAAAHGADGGRLTHPRRAALRRGRRRLVRRGPAERLRSRPAGGRGPVALLHLGAARRAARDPRPPAADAPLRERPAAGAGRRPAGRRGAGRRLPARHHAGLQPDAPDEPRDAPSASSPAGSTRRRSRSTRSPSPSRPATACASPSRRPTGRGRGPRPSPSRSPWSPARASSSCRCGRSVRRTRTCGRSTRRRSPRVSARRRSAEARGGRAYTRDLAADDVTWTFRYVDGGNVVLPNGWESEEWNR